MNRLRWRAYLALKWLAMAVCPPLERSVIEALEERQAEMLRGEM